MAGPHLVIYEGEDRVVLADTRTKHLSRLPDDFFEEEPVGVLRTAGDTQTVTGAPLEVIMALGTMRH